VVARPSRTTEVTEGKKQVTAEDAEDAEDILSGSVDIATGRDCKKNDVGKLEPPEAVTKESRPLVRTSRPLGFPLRPPRSLAFLRPGLKV